MSIMINEIIENLNINNNGIYIDCTFGHGKHSLYILNKLGINGKLISMDKDINSYSIAKKIINNKFLFINDNFSSIKKHIFKLKLIGKINGVLLDLGISKNQMNDYSRGFSYNLNGPLDMRINNKTGIKASDFLNNESEYKIYKVLKKFGEDINSKKIAKNIVLYRKKNLILNTFDLKKIILKLNLKNKNKTLSRCFQAIRIYINDEINELINVLKDIPDILSKNGKLLVITFHSIEDRIVKNFFKISYYKIFEKFLNYIPIINNEIIKIKKKNIKMIEIKKIKPSINEINNNKSSRSAILRIFKLN